MKFLVIAVVGGIALGLFVWWVVFRAVSQAFDWFIYTFGNERAAKVIERKWHERNFRSGR